jgi:hypothetical protein
MGFASGSCSLIIYGNDKLNFDEIKENLKIKPSNIVKKGEIKYKCGGEIKSDAWIYKIEMEEGKEPNETLERLLKDLKPSIGYLKKLDESVDVSITCYVQSDLAQIGFDFSSDVIRDLAELSIKFGISILSWGQVEMNEAEDDDIGE